MVCRLSLSTHLLLLQSFVNCTCIRNRLVAQAMEQGSGSGSPNDEMGNVSIDALMDQEFMLKESNAFIGACDQGCQLLIPHIIISVIGFILLFLLEVPFIFITIRYLCA